MSPEPEDHMMTQSSLSGLAHRLDDLRRQKTRMEDELRTLTAEIEQLAYRDIPDLMDSLGMSSVRIVGLGTVSLREDVFATVGQDRRQEAYDWLRQHGEGDLVQETINSSTLRAWAKRRLTAGEETPDWLNVHVRTGATITKR